MATYRLRTTPCCGKAEQGSTFVYEFTASAPSVTCGYCGAAVVEFMARVHVPPEPEPQPPSYRECDGNAGRGEYNIRGTVGCEGMGPRAPERCPLLYDICGDERPCICCDTCRLDCMERAAGG